MQLPNPQSGKDPKLLFGYTPGWHHGYPGT